MSTKVMYIQGSLVKYDSDDLWLVEGRTWYLNKGITNIGWYVTTSIREGRKVRKEYLHRLVAGAKRGDRVEFISRDSLDCRRDNLRINGRRLQSGR